MKLRLLPTVAAAFLIFVGATAAFACEHEQKTAAAQATAKAASSSCATKDASAVTAAHEGCAGMDGAATAAKASCPYSGATAASAKQSCISAHATAVTASNESCQGKSSKTSAATAVTAEARSTGVTAVPAGSSCSGHGSKTADKAHGDCDWCSDMALCDEELRQIGVETQVVPLKNGVMVLYQATSPRGVEAVQASITRRSDRLGGIVAAGDQAHLCPKCKEMRGAMASGKLVRETVNIEGGCLTVMTSDDPKVVAQIQAMSGVGAEARAKKT